VLLLLADHVEADGLGERSALADSDDVTDLDAERGGAVGGERLVALLESVVLLDIVQVVASDDDGALHLGRNDDTPEKLKLIQSDPASGVRFIINKYRESEQTNTSEHLLENTATDADIRGERAFFVNVVSFDCLLGGFEALINVRLNKL
jgi:hypothetical protein